MEKIISIIVGLIISISAIYLFSAFGFGLFFDLIDSRIEKKLPITCESKGEVLESFRYDEKKKQIILQCVR